MKVYKMNVWIDRSLGNDTISTRFHLISYKFLDENEISTMSTKMLDSLRNMGFYNGPDAYGGNLMCYAADYLFNYDFVGSTQRTYNMLYDVLMPFLRDDKINKLIE